VDGSAALFTAPKAPSIRASSKAKGALLITVTNSSANGGSPITEYQYSLNGGTWIDSSHHALASFRIEHLKAGETYRVAVRAVNVVGTGVSSVHRSVKID
jgi:predicted phage tail protein